MTESRTKPSTATLTQFRKPLTRGDDYTNPEKVKPQQLTVSPTGKTDKEAQLHIANCRRIGNEWDMLSSEFDTQKKKHKAHQKMFDAGSAQISAAGALTSASTTWNRYQVTVADNRISRNEARVAIASIPIEIQRQNTELEKKKANLDKSRMELESTLITNSRMREDLSHDKMMARLDGYRIEVNLPQMVTQNISGLLRSTGDLQGEL